MNEKTILLNERSLLRDPSQQQPFGSFFYFKVSSWFQAHWSRRGLGIRSPALSILRVMALTFTIYHFIMPPQDTEV